MFSYTILIFILLNVYCYSSPVSYVDQNQSVINPTDEQQDMIKTAKNDQIYYYHILCALYNDCYNTNNNDQQGVHFTDFKPKRLTSSLFHGIPKFGKRAFVSAFSGIPKFG